MITPLNIKTEYSLLSSMIKIKDLINFALKNNLKTLNITDNNMCGVMEFYNACCKNNIKPIVGLEIEIENTNIILYAKNFSGYKNLLKITSNEINYLNIKKYSKDLICIVPFSSIKIYENLNKIYEEIFISFKNKEEEKLIVETNKLYMHEVLYLEESDDEYVKYLYAIKDNLKEPFELDLSNRCLDYKSKLFNENNEYVNNVCDLKIEYDENLLPVFECPDHLDGFSYLKKLCIEGLKKIFGSHVGSMYQERLKHELSIINKMGFSNYFLIVQDYVNFAKKSGILVGAGRGSAAGSLVAYLLNITEIDPLKYNLLFERFLNPERISMPDIDVDFEFNRRGEVIDYCIKKYGLKRVAPIITFGTLASKQIIRDLGRVKNLNVEYLTSFIDSNLSLMENYKNNEKLKKFLEINNEYKELFKIGIKLEGNKKHASIHAAGVVISKIDLDEVIPLVKNHEEFYITGYSMEYLEKIGLLKMDFLALKNLTLLNDILKDLEKDNIKESLKEIPLNDLKTIEIFKSSKTTGIFQFESAGMMNFLRKYKPSNFEDIVAAIALYRPGPMKNIDSYIKRKNGLEKIDYIDDSLINILKPTYGIIVYQEQIMQIAVTLAGYSLAEADLLRKAMSKKNETILVNEKEKFVRQSIERGFKKETILKVYDLILKFAEYGFNRAHSVAYSKIAFEMAYLKAHYYKYFMKNLLSMASSSDKIMLYIYEAKEAGLKILKPSINYSSNQYEIKENALIYPLSSIRNVGHQAVKTILDERNNGSFKDIFDFIKRVYNKGINKKTLESLILAGALNEFGFNEKTLIDSLDELVNYSEVALYNDEIPKPVLEQKENYSKKELMNFEEELYGFYLSNHLITEHRSNYKNYLTIKDIANYFNKNVDLIFLVEKIKEVKTKKNENMLFITVSDETDLIDLIIFPKNYKDFSNFSKGDIIIVNGHVEKRFDKYQIVVNHLIDSVKQ